MPVSRFLAAAVCGGVLAGLLAVSVGAQDEPAFKQTPDPQSGMLEKKEPSGPSVGGWPDKPGPGRPEGFFPGPPDRRGRAPGPPSQKESMRPGHPGGPGPGLGPGWPHPPGPPRWPFWDWSALEKSDPEMYKLLKEEADLDRRSLALAAQYRRAPAEGREEIKKELSKLVDQHFDVRQKRRQLELKRLEEGLQRLRDAIEQRNKARKQIVEKRVIELLGQEADIGF